MPAALEEAEKNAARWLVGQMVPNETVPAPAPDRRRLVLSYRVSRNDPAYPYVYGRSFVYDDALAAIALTMVGNYREAEFLLNALAALVRPDGGLWFGYNTQNDWPAENDHEGAITRTGSVAWVGYALTWYLQVRSQSNPQFARTDLLGTRFLQAAESIGRFITAHRVTDTADARYGLVTGGAGSSTVTLSGSDRQPMEVYDPSEVRWVSMEHNIDAWFFLRDLGRLTSDPSWGVAADLIRDRLLLLWSAKDRQFIQGIHEDLGPDTALPLDGASWGALFLMAAGRDAQAQSALSVMEERFGSRFDGSRGYRPYGAEPVYTDARVNRFYFPGNPRMLWKDLPFVWGEGSLGAAAALLRSGKRDAGLAAIQGVLPLMEDGGFRYASGPVAYQFTSYPSAATTSWFIIAVEMLRGGPAAARFWGP